MNDLSSNTPSPDASFNEITQLIVAARQRAVQAVNTELIELQTPLRNPAGDNSSKIEAVNPALPVISSHDDLKKKTISEFH